MLMKTNIKKNYDREIRGLVELKINHREMQTTKDSQLNTDKHGNKEF